MPSATLESASASTTLESPSEAGRAAGLSAATTPCTTSGGLVLNDVLVDAWERLAARGVVECPVCGGTLETEAGAEGSALAGRCSGCGSVLE